MSMKNMVGVSICIPVYNAGKYLSYTLESIVNQTYQNIEIIISDNASDDDTFDIVCSFMERDGRIKYRRNNYNIGYVKNIHCAINEARYEYIAIFHADDIYESNIIEAELHALKQNKELSAIFTKCRHFSTLLPEEKSDICEPWESLLPYNSQTFIYYGVLDDFIPVLLKYGNPFCCPSFMTRKCDYIESGGFADRYPSNEDLELWIKYLRLGKTLAILNRTLVNYRHSPIQGSVFWWNKLDLPVFYEVVDNMILPLIDNGMDILKIYSRRKSENWLNLAYRIPLNDPRRRTFIQRSAASYRYSIFTEEGIRQLFPFAFDKLREEISDIKKRISKKWPRSYILIKRIYHFVVVKK